MKNSKDIEVKPKGFNSIDDFVKRCREVSCLNEVTIMGEHLKLLYEMAGVDSVGNPERYMKKKISGPEMRYLLDRIVNTNPDIYYS